MAWKQDNAVRKGDYPWCSEKAMAGGRLNNSARRSAGCSERCGKIAGILLGQGRHAANRRLNVWDNGDSLIVEAELPGVRKDQLDISVMENELTLKCQRPEEEDKNVTYHRRERPIEALGRVIRLPVAVDADRVSAAAQRRVEDHAAQGAEPPSRGRSTWRRDSERKANQKEDFPMAQESVQPP